MKANMYYNYNDDLDKKDSKPEKATLKVINGMKEEKKMSVDYLNEKLIYFYNHGGPIMEL
jgi:hypothetical protein